MKKLSEVFAPKIDLTSDFRMAANLGSACAACLLITPFAINNFVQGRYVLGIASCCVVFVLGFNAWSILHGRFRPVLIVSILVPALILAISLIIKKQQIIGVLWAYPAVLSFYFLLKERQAWFANILFLLFILPLVWFVLDNSLAVRATITLTLVSILSALFIRLISYQQSKLLEAKENAEAAGRARSESEHQVRLIADNSPAYIAYVGIEDLRYHFVNQKFESGFGIPREEIVGMHIREVIGESNYQVALRYIEQVKSGVPTSYINVFNLEQGRRWVQVNYVPDFDDHGRVKGIVVFSYDVTETKSAEERLRESERRLSEIIDFLPDPTFAIDSNGRVIIWNKAIEQMTGIAAEEMVGKGDHEYAVPFYGERRPIVVNMVTNYDEQIASQYDSIRRDGGRLIAESCIPNFGDRGAIWLEGVAAALCDEQGTVVGAIEAIRDITELKETERKLRESEEFYRQLVESAGEGILIVDRSGKLVFANQRAAELSGYTTDELLTYSAIELVHPEDQPTVNDRIRRIIKGDSTHHYFTYRTVCKDGTFKWLNQSSTVGILWNGRPANLCLVSDITEMKKAEEALRESQELFSLFMDMLPHGVFIKEHDSTCIYVNQYVKDLFDGEQWIGKNAYDAFPDPQLAEAMHADDQKALAEGQTTVEETMPDNNGVERVFQTTKFRIPRADKPPLLGGIGLDITERAKAREDLRQSEEKYRTLYRQAKETEELYNSLLESTLDAIVTYDMEGHVTYVNNAFTETFGWVKEELAKGVPYTPDSEKEITMRNVTQVTREGIPLKDFETKRLRKDGCLVDVGISASRFNDHQGNPAGMLVILRDITERRQAEKELAEALETAEKLRDEAQAASRAKSEFVANMSHEIRTPMNAIMGMTDLAMRSDISPKLRDYLTKIHTSSQSLLGIINDILDFSKIEAGRLDMELVRFDLRRIIRNMSAVVCASEQCRDIEFLTATGSDVPYGLVGDPLRLEQVLTNLATNAVKFTPEGEVLVRVETKDASGDRVRLLFSVRDTGIGIPDDKIETLFKPFTQADGSTTRQFGGSGLGLTICRRLIEMMGGEIQIESEPGKGSLFSFELEFDVQPYDDEQPIPTPEDMHGMRVLVVDDNETSQEILLDILKSFSFKATAVGSGEEALEELIAAQHETAYDLALLDWRMSGIDGIETARRIDREARLSGRIPKIIMITAFSTEEVKRQAEEAGLDAFLSKPVQPSLLLDTIMDVFGKESPRMSEAAQARARQAMGGDRIREARILIAEDNEINQQVAREILEYAGAHVHTAWDGKEAVEAVNESEFDAVLMDIQMPEMDGYEATRLIRSDERYADLPIIAMTAHAMAGDREKSIQAGMNDHIPKPVNAELVLGTLAKWVDTSDREPSADVSSREVSTVWKYNNLPDRLQGIDIGSALDRLRGNATLLRKLLSDFEKNYGDSGNKLRAAIDSRDYVSARNLAHAVKGVAGTLSMSTLHDAASQLEKASLKGNHEECEKNLVQFQHALAEVCRSIAPLVERTEDTQLDRPASAGRSEAVDLEIVSEIVKELTRLARLNHLDSITYLASVKEDLSTLGLFNDVRKLEEAVEDTDFEKALEILNRITESLGFTIEG